MENMQNIDYLWLIAGGILIVLEFILLPGVGFLFAGLGALVVGLLLVAGLALGLPFQWIIFFAATIAWALVLWKPMKHFKTGKNEKPFSDIAGQKAVVVAVIKPGKLGKARWSGTIMNAKAEDESAGIIEGDEVVILRAEGNVLIVQALIN